MRVMQMARISSSWSAAETAEEDLMNARLDLREALAEIARHHQDFRSIDSILDSFAASEMTAVEALKRIRNLVA